MDEKPSVSFITCAVWVPRGVAKADPEKVEIPKEELARIIKETKDDIQELEEIEEDEWEELEKGAEDEDKCQELEKDAAEEGSIQKIIEEKENKEIELNEEGKVKEDKKKKKKKKKQQQQQQKQNVKEEDEENFESLYSLKDYDEENDDGMNQLLKLGLLTVHSSNDDDPYFTVKDNEDEDSEEEDHKILPSDSLIAVGHVEEDAAILEVYVYNDEGSLYVHHDILLPAVPLCMEWLNYDPGDEQLRPGNMLAVGSMSPLIKIWDLDLMDCLEPAFTLGKKESKKKKIPGVGHKDAVLSLSWNKHFEHVLASGSVDQTVILWDLQNGTVGQTIKSFEEKVQALSWHHSEAHTLLTGACDGKVRMFDCRDIDTCKSWKLDGEVECVVWETDCNKPYICVASTDKGTVFGIDIRKEKPLWTLKAHDKACTAVSMNSKCPGCMVTVSSDESVRIWDIDSGEPQFIEVMNPRLGTIQCLAACPDSSFVFCMGGDNKENNFKVWDARGSSMIRSTFCSRAGLPADGEEMDAEEITKPNFDKKRDEASRAPHAPTTNQNTGAKSKPKYGKKKGGHLGKRGKRW